MGNERSHSDRQHESPKEASADQHAGCFFWSIYRTFLIIAPDLTAEMYDEVLAEPGLKHSEKIRHPLKGHVSFQNSNEKWELVLKSQDSKEEHCVALLKLGSGELIADIFTTKDMSHLAMPSANFPRSILFEPA